MTDLERVETDVVIVGGGAAGLATAIHLCDLIAGHNQKNPQSPLPMNVLLIEKGGGIGNHTLSGAIINPISLKELLPEVAEKDFPFESPVTSDELLFLTNKGTLPIPYHPPVMRNKGNFVATLAKVVRWLADIAQKKGAQVYTGFDAHEAVVEGNRVVGIRTGATGIDHNGNRKPNYQPPTEVRAKITILAEGPRGSVTKALTQKLNLQQNRNPQIYSTGIKELWEVPAGTFPEGRVVHTMGFPLSNEEFGGGFIYGLKDNKVAIGFVVGLDYLDPTFDPHNAFQVYKKHPFIQKIIEKGRMIRYGAKTVPEGGLFSMPKLASDGLMIVGDSASFLNMPALKGVHLAIKSGMLAAESAFEALKANNFSEQQLSLYEKSFKQSWAYKELWKVRNFRQAFHNNTFLGLIRYSFQIITGGRGFSLSGKLKVKDDGEMYKPLAQVKGRSFKERFKDQLHFDKKYTFDKVTDVYFSGTHHEENQPVHLIVPDLNLCYDTCVPKYGAPCQRFCPAEVYEMAKDNKSGENHLVIHAENCVHCKTCDVKDPYHNINWVTPYGGDGPDYKDL